MCFWWEIILIITLQHSFHSIDLAYYVFQVLPGHHLSLLKKTLFYHYLKSFSPLTDGVLFNFYPYCFFHNPSFSSKNKFQYLCYD